MQYGLRRTPAVGRAWRAGVGAWGLVAVLGSTSLAVGASGSGVADAARGSSLASRSAHASAARAQNANATKVIYEQDRGVVQPGMTGGFVERCPATAPQAISGYFGPGDKAAYGQLTLAASAPVGHGDRSWGVGVKNLGSQPAAYFVGVVCASAQQPFALVRNSGTVDGGQTAGYTEPCPKVAPRPIGGFFYLQNSTAGELELAQSINARRGWATVVKNVTAQPQAYVLGAVCARRGVRVSYLVSDVLSVAPSQANGASGRCPKPTSHAVGGLFYAPGSQNVGHITLADTYPFGAIARPRGWETDVVNLTSQPQNFVDGTVCVG